MGFQIPFHPRFFLFQGFRESLNTVYYEIIVVHMLMLASVLIASCWKSPKIPSLQEWRHNKYYMFLLAKLSYISKIIDNMKAMMVFL